MMHSNETTAFSTAISTDAAEAELPTTLCEEYPVMSKRTDRPATAAIKRDDFFTALDPINADEATQVALAFDAEMVRQAMHKMRAPFTNLTNLFHLITDDLDSLPILQSEMLWEVHAQMAKIERIVSDFESQVPPAPNSSKTAAPIPAINYHEVLFTATRNIRTPLANMQGVLSLVLDDRSVMPSAVAEMLLCAFEQLEKLARIVDEISEVNNLLEGHMEVRYNNAALEETIDRAVHNAKDEGFEFELIRSNQIPADALKDLDPTVGQCLEALIRHSLLDTLNFPNEMAVGLFVYIDDRNPADPALVLELHDHCVRARNSRKREVQGTLDQQVVAEMAATLQGHTGLRTDASGKNVMTCILPLRVLRGTVVPVMAPTASGSAPAVITCQGIALLAPKRRLSRVVEEAVAGRLKTQTILSFEQLLTNLSDATMPTIFIDADLLDGLTHAQFDQLRPMLETLHNVFMLYHGENDVEPSSSFCPGIWDDDLIAIMTMLDKPFRPGAMQENLVLLTSDNSTELRPWRKLLSSTGHGMIWWPCRRPVNLEIFPAALGGILALVESTGELSQENWKALSAMTVRDRKIIVLTGSNSCLLPSSRGWDIYRPNLNVIDDTLRRYILFNAPDRRTPRVAVIEDDILMRKLLVAAVEDQAQMVEIASVQDALDKLRTMSFDVILLDLFLPDGSGMKVLEAIQTDPRLAKARATPIIALTGSTDLELNQQVLAKGAIEVLVKPVPMQVLRQKIALLTKQNRDNRLTAPRLEETAVLPAMHASPVAARPGSSKVINLKKLSASQAPAISHLRDVAGD